MLQTQTDPAAMVSAYTGLIDALDLSMLASDPLPALGVLLTRDRVAASEGKTALSVDQVSALVAAAQTLKAAALLGLAASFMLSIRHVADCIDTNSITALTDATTPGSPAMLAVPYCRVEK